MWVLRAYQKGCSHYLAWHSEDTVWKSKAWNLNVSDPRHSESKVLVRSLCSHRQTHLRLGPSTFPPSSPLHSHAFPWQALLLLIIGWRTSWAAPWKPQTATVRLEASHPLPNMTAPQEASIPSDMPSLQFQSVLPQNSSQGEESPSFSANLGLP